MEMYIYIYIYIYETYLSLFNFNTYGFGNFTEEDDLEFTAHCILSETAQQYTELV